MKLYPPYIEGTIPAFYTDSKGTVLTVPFSMNRTVAANQVQGFSLKLKAAQSNTYLFATDTHARQDFDIESKYEIYFNLNSYVDKLNVGDFYKVQIAYIDDEGVTGYYSTVGVVKYTTQPSVYIEKLIAHNPNIHQYTYQGVYRQYAEDNKGINVKDTTEKEYQYRFILKDQEGNIIDDTGFRLHNVENNVESYESKDEYKYLSDIPVATPYYLQYIVYTNNKMTVSSSAYKIVQKKSIPPEIEASISAELNYDEGYIDVQLKGDLDIDGKEKAATGAFVISRACSDDNFSTWNEVFRFILRGQHPSLQLFRDFTFEQGKQYIYSLQQYNDFGLYSSRMLSNIVEGDFEDMFLFDGKRQLKVRFNPKVSSFKINHLETKTDTIGSQFPFFFKNGIVEYREFPINGLISYWSDTEELFMTAEEIGLDTSFDNKTRPHADDKKIQEIKDADTFWYQNKKYKEAIEAVRAAAEEDRIAIPNAKIRTTQLTGYNIAAERNFKLAVLEWLGNGQVKLFRSPGEGNYLVRLMNVSLTPEDRVGRMIHSFQATAYEVAAFNYDNLIDHGITSIRNAVIKQLRWESLDLSIDINPQDDRYIQDFDIWYLQGNILTKHNQAQSVRFDGLMPGSLVQVRIKGKDLEDIIIGATGSYILDLDLPIDQIIIPDGARLSGIVTYSYYTDTQNVFNAVKDVNVYDMLGQFYIGSHSNIVPTISDIKTHLLYFYYLHFRKRDVEPSETTTAGMLEQGENNPLSLYRLEMDSIMAVDANDNTLQVEIPGLKKVSTEIVRRDLVAPDSSGNGDPIVASKYYHFNAQASSISRAWVSGGAFDENIQYYEHQPFVRYIDYTKGGINSNAPIILDKDSYQRIIELGIIMRSVAEIQIQNVELYSNQLSIDGHVMDLTDREKFTIDDLVVFDSIELDNGVYLDCGFQIQEIEYSIEDEVGIVNTTIQTKYKKDRYDLSVEKFYELLSSLEYVADANTENSMLQTYITEYRAALADAPATYGQYKDLVQAKITEWEVTELYEPEA